MMLMVVMMVMVVMMKIPIARETRNRMKTTIDRIHTFFSST